MCIRDSVNTLTYPKPIPKFNADGTVNQDLNILPLGVNNAVIQQIKKNN